MEVQIPWLGVVLAALSAIVIGMIWYSPSVLGKQWMKITGIKEADMKKQMAPATVTLVVVSLLTAYVMAHFINYTHLWSGESWMNSGLQTAFWAWLGFGVTTIVAHGIFEPRDKQVMLINAGNRLATYLAMGVILGAFLK